MLDLASPEKLEFMAELASVLPPSLSRLQLCAPAGSDAVDGAIKLCKLATGRRTVLAMHGAYHGTGHGTMGLLGKLGTKEHLPGLMPDVHFLPFPATYRHP